MNVCKKDVQISIIGLQVTQHYQACVNVEDGEPGFLSPSGRLYLMIAGRGADSSSPSSGRNWLQLVLPERFCQVFDRLRSYFPYKSSLLCHLKCTRFSRRASILYQPSLNKANSAITIWR